MQWWKVTISNGLHFTVNSEMLPRAFMAKDIMISHITEI